MQILIANPVSHMERFAEMGDKMNLDDVETFYSTLPNILDQNNIKYKMLYLRSNKPVIYNEPDSIYLSWHTHGTLANIWHLKTSYIPGYFSFDKNGYGPWSELVTEGDYEIPVELVRKNVENFCKDYVDNKKSRVKQPNASFGIPDEPYVLVLGQRPDDPVSKFADIDTMTLMHKVSELYKDTKYKVCTKQHPLESGIPYGTATDIQLTGNIHDCIAGASAIYTVNSGSGFEALLHGKRVFTTGQCDYHWATDVIKNDEDLANSVELIEEPIDEDNRIKFLYYAITYHFVDITNPDAIMGKILRTVMEYEES